MASSGHTSQSTTHDMGRPSGKTRPQAQARRSTSQTSQAPDLSAGPKKIFRFQRSVRTRRRVRHSDAQSQPRSEKASTLISQTYPRKWTLWRWLLRTTNISRETANATASRRPWRKRRTRYQRRHLEAATARNHQHLRRTPLTSDHRTRPSATPRRPRRATTRGRHGHAQRSRSTSAKRSALIFNGERRLLLTSRRADNSSAWNER